MSDENVLNEVCNIANIANEIVFVGAIYKNPNLIVSYSRMIRSEIDFVDPITKFFYDMAVLMYQTYTQDFTENSVNTFMIQDEGRKQIYKSFKGWKAIDRFKKQSNEDDVVSYYATLKKYTLLREYANAGFNVEKVMEHKEFPKWNALTISRMMTAKLNKINTNVLIDKTSNDLSKNATSKVRSYLTSPCMGIPLPYKTINASIKGTQLGTMMAIGLTSNSGKSREEVSIMIYLALINNVKVLILENEMSEKAIFNCMITTIINSPDIKKEHNWNIEIKEEDMTLGKYKDANGNYIYRAFNPVTLEQESDDDFIKRVEENSPEFNELMKITEYVENELRNRIFIKDVSGDYSDEALECEIRKHNQIYGIQYIAYGTLKNPEEKWELLKRTTTRLSETIKEINVFLLVMVQLTDDTVFTDALELSSNNIAGSKQIKHVLDTLILGKEIECSDWSKYEYCNYNQAYGEPNWKDLPHTLKRLYSKIVDKNRNGNKPKLLFEVDLDLNTWKELGIIRKKEVMYKTKKQEK